MFDLTSKSTFKDVEKWIQDIKDYGPEDCICLIVGNKVDLESEREVTFEEAVSFAKKHKFDYIEVSAETNFGIKFLFDILSKSVLNYIEKDKAKGSKARLNFDGVGTSILGETNKKDDDNKCFC